MLTRRTHISDHEEVFLRVRGPGYENPVCDAIYSLKPNGFWYAIDDRYLASLGSAAIGKYQYRVNLGETMLAYLSCAAAVREFSATFRSGEGIDWASVASVYDGVELNPYDSVVAGQVDWYHMWEYACGVVWRPGNVTLRAEGRIDRNRVGAVLRAV